MSGALAAETATPLIALGTHALRGHNPSSLLTKLTAGPMAVKPQSLDDFSTLDAPQPGAPGNDRVRNIKRQGTAGERRPSASRWAPSSAKNRSAPALSAAASTSQESVEDT